MLNVSHVCHTNLAAKHLCKLLSGDGRETTVAGPTFFLPVPGVCVVRGSSRLDYIVLRGLYRAGGSLD